VIDIIEAEMMTRIWGMGILALAVACKEAPPAAAPAATAPSDAAHQNLTGPHGDHSPKHGGLVLMNGDVHYEVVLSADGRHAIWFSDAVRSELPASVARNVTIQITRPGVPVEPLKLEIDESGEAWVAHGKPVEGADVIAKVQFSLQGEPHEVEIPFVASALAPR
jgi:hypothetical protein